MLLLSYKEQMIYDLPRSNTLKVETLAAREDGRQHFMHICRGHDEDRIGWRLLQCLEQGIKSFGGKHMRFVKHVDLILTRGGGHHYLLAQVANTVDTTVRGCINLDHIKRVACRNLTALLAFVARLAVFRVAAINRFSKQAGCAGFTGTSRPCKEIGMSHVATSKGVFERANNRLLTNKIIKSL